MLVSGDKDIIIKSTQVEPLTSSQGLSVVRYSGEILDPMTKEFIAHRYEFVAQITNRSRIDDLNYIASVKFTNLGVQPGDLVIAYRAVNKTVALNRNAQKGSGQKVVGFEYEGSTIGGRGNFIVLETTQSPLESGRDYFIYQQNTSHRIYSTNEKRG